MSIILKSDVEVLKSTRVYSIESKNRTIIDVIFDKMHKKNKMTWIIQFTSFSFSTFVIWKDIFNDVKKRVVMNIRELNKITLTNSYSLSLQSNIISAIIDYEYINIVDVVNWFHQFNVQKTNRHKFIVISHRDQKQFNVTLMNFKNSSSYVQRQTNQMFRFYRQFSRVFIDDIVIFFYILKKHFQHLNQIFDFFINKRVNLTSIKSFLNYFFIILLKQRVDNLELFIFEKKNCHNFSAIFEFLERSEIFFELDRMISSLRRTLCSIDTIVNRSKNDIFQTRYQHWQCQTTTIYSVENFRFYSREDRSFQSIAKRFRRFYFFDSFRFKSSFVRRFKRF